MLSDPECTVICCAGWVTAVLPEGWGWLAACKDSAAWYRDIRACPESYWGGNERGSISCNISVPFAEAEKQELMKLRTLNERLGKMQSIVACQ
jgi:hypothetical protein